MALLLMRSLAVVLTALSLARVSLVASRSTLQSGDGLMQGPQTIGFTVRPSTHRSRRGTSRPARLQVACWYPATAAEPARSRLTVADYLALNGTDDPATPGPEAVAEYRRLLIENGVTADHASAWFSTAANARRDVPLATGEWPLVLVAQGNGQSAYDQALLSELIASDGFIVCTVPSPTRLLGPMKSESDIPKYAAAQATLLDEAARVARGSLRADGRRPALVGHSFGARAALVYADRHGARALVSLDGGIGFAQGRHWIQRRQRNQLTTRFSTPLLHIYETDEPAAAPDFTLIESLARSRRLLVRIDGLRHIDFTSAGFASANIPGLFGPDPASLRDKLAAIARYTRSFLKAEVQQDPAARAFISAPPQPATAPWLTVRRLSARGR